MIENTKLFFVVVVVVVCVCVYIYIYNLSNKKCVYIIKKCAYVYIYVCGSCLDKYISVTLSPPQIKISGSAPAHNLLIKKKKNEDKDTQFRNDRLL